MLVQFLQPVAFRGTWPGDIYATNPDYWPLDYFPHYFLCVYLSKGNVGGGGQGGITELKGSKH